MNFGANFDLYSEAFRMLRIATSLLREGTADPATLLKLAPKAIALQDRAMALLADPRAGRTILRTPNLTAITIAALAVNPVDGDSVAITWPRDGRVIGIRCGTSDGTDVANSRTSVNVLTDDGSKNLFTDGQKDAYVPFAAINTVASPYWPLFKKVKQNDRWNVTCRNEATGSSDPVTVFPFITWAFAPGKFIGDEFRPDEE